MALRNDDFLDELLSGSEKQSYKSDKDSHEVDDILNFATRKKLENAMDKDVDRILKEDALLSKAKKYPSPEKTQSFEIPDKLNQTDDVKDNYAKTITFNTSEFSDIKKIDFEEPSLFDRDESDFDGSDKLLGTGEKESDFSVTDTKTRTFQAASFPTRTFNNTEVKKAAFKEENDYAGTMQFNAVNTTTQTKRFEKPTLADTPKSDSNNNFKPVNPDDKAFSEVSETDASYKKTARHIKAEKYEYDTDVEEVDLNCDENKKLPIAAAVAVLIGLIALGFFIMYCISGSNSANSAQSETASIEKAVFPAVAADLGTFSTPEEIPNDTLIVSAIFNMISNIDLSQNYTVVDGYVTIPQSDIEYYAEILYGADLSIENHTVNYYSLEIAYDETAESYTFEANPPFYSYVPQIENVVYENNMINVEVAYMVQTPAWAEYAETYNSDMYLYAKAEYTLCENDGRYIIKSVSII